MSTMDPTRVLYTGDAVSGEHRTGAEIIAEFAPEVEPTAQNIHDVAEQFELRPVQDSSGATGDAPAQATEQDAPPQYVPRIARGIMDGGTRFYRNTSGEAVIAGRIDTALFPALSSTDPDALSIIDRDHRLRLGPIDQNGHRDAQFHTPTTGKSWIEDLQNLSEIINEALGAFTT